MKKIIMAALGAATFAFAVPAVAQELPVTSGDYWDVGAISVDDGHFPDYVDFLAGEYRKRNDFAKSKGWIKGYRILSNVNPRDGEPDIYLITIFACLCMAYAGLARLVATNNLSEALKFRDVFASVRSNSRPWLMMVLVSLLAGLVAGLGLIACGIGVLFTAFYSYLIMGHALGQTVAQQGGVAGTYAPAPPPSYGPPPTYQ